MYNIAYHAVWRIFRGVGWGRGQMALLCVFRVPTRVVGARAAHGRSRHSCMIMTALWVGRSQGSRF
jgi:hypothetical protein